MVTRLLTFTGRKRQRSVPHQAVIAGEGEVVIEDSAHVEALPGLALVLDPRPGVLGDQVGSEPQILRVRAAQHVVDAHSLHTVESVLQGEGVGLGDPRGQAGQGPHVGDVIVAGGDIL